MTDALHNFFTYASLGTFAGASGAVIVVSNTIRKLLKLDSPWPSFIVALVIALAGAYSAKSLNGFLDILLVFLNGCLLFCSAAGIQETAVTTIQPRQIGKTNLQGAPQVKWLSSWFH